jgi:hypothetical protein
MNSHVILALIHVLVIVPALLFIGLAREQVPDSVFSALLPLGVFIGVYHAYKAYLKIKDNQSPWINYIHIFLLAPLLIILGYYGKTANRKYFEMLLLLGFAAFGYHSLTLAREFIHQ